nr:F-box protein At5g49610-like [Malus domestica]
MSTLMNISINNLPESVLVEILCRLPCANFIFQCKCVCKRWFTLISSRHFVNRFLRLQIDNKMPVVRTLINRNGEEFLNRIQPSSEVIPHMLKRLQSLHGLRREPVVVATYNDLILCSNTLFDQTEYYICNPYTTQWVALPRPRWGRDTIGTMPVGLICDGPYYKEDGQNDIVELNDNYRYKVVRILHPNDEFNFDPDGYFYNFKVEIFSSETGKWRELVVSSPQGIIYDTLDYMAFVYNGVLYWSGHRDGCFLVLGLDPFADQECSFTVFDYPEDENFVVECPSVSGGVVRMSDFHRDTRTLYVWDLKEQDDDSVAEGGSKLCLSKQEVYSLDQEMYPDDAQVVQRLNFDPNDEDIFYLEVDGDIIMCNIRTRKWSKIVENTTLDQPLWFYLFVLPWWPTPIPSLRQPASARE